MRYSKLFGKTRKGSKDLASKNATLLIRGVFDVVFSGDGTITLDYSSDGTTYDDLVEKITECGFTANGIEPKNGDKNLCKTEKKTK